MAMNSVLANLVTEVYLLTKRPDLETATKMAVKNATLKLHTSDFFAKDLFEAGINFPSAAFQQQLEYRTLLPRWRALKYIRKVSQDVTTGEFVGTDFLTILSPEAVLDSYGIAKDDIAYIAGEVINIRSSTSEQQYILGCYIHPVLSEETFSSWIANEYKEAVLYDAAATIFKGIGFDEQAAQFRNDGAIWARQLMINNVPNTGM